MCATTSRSLAAYGGVWVPRLASDTTLGRSAYSVVLDLERRGETGRGGPTGQALVGRERRVRARLRSQLRRVQGALGAADKILKLGDVVGKVVLVENQVEGGPLDAGAWRIR